VRRLFPRSGGRKSFAFKARKRRKAARNRPIIPADERTFDSVLAFLDATADDVDLIQRQIRRGCAEVQEKWTDAHREKARRGLTKSEIAAILKDVKLITMRDPSL
jgi:hypothetical protein